MTTGKSLKFSVFRSPLTVRAEIERSFENVSVRLELANGFPGSSRARDHECDNRRWLALQVRLQVERTVQKRRLLDDSCEPFLRFLKDGLRKFYD